MMKLSEEANDLLETYRRMHSSDLTLAASIATSREPLSTEMAKMCTDSRILCAANSGTAVVTLPTGITGFLAFYGLIEDPTGVIGRPTPRLMLFADVTSTGIWKAYHDGINFLNGVYVYPVLSQLPNTQILACAQSACGFNLGAQTTGLTLPGDLFAMRVEGPARNFSTSTSVRGKSNQPAGSYTAPFGPITFDASEVSSDTYSAVNSSSAVTTTNLGRMQVILASAGATAINPATWNPVRVNALDVPGGVTGFLLPLGTPGSLTASVTLNFGVSTSTVAVRTGFISVIFEVPVIIGATASTSFVSTQLGISTVLCNFTTASYVTTTVAGTVPIPTGATSFTLTWNYADVGTFTSFTCSTISTNFVMTGMVNRARAGVCAIGLSNSIVTLSPSAVLKYPPTPGQENIAGVVRVNTAAAELSSMIEDYMPDLAVASPTFLSRSEYNRPLVVPMNSSVPPAVVDVLKHDPSEHAFVFPALASLFSSLAPALPGIIGKGVELVRGLTGPQESRPTPEQTGQSAGDIVKLLMEALEKRKPKDAAAGIAVPTMSRSQKKAARRLAASGLDAAANQLLITAAEKRANRAGGGGKNKAMTLSVPAAHVEEWSEGQVDVLRRLLDRVQSDREEEQVYVPAPLDPSVSCLLVYSGLAIESGLYHVLHDRNADSFSIDFGTRIEKWKIASLAFDNIPVTGFVSGEYQVDTDGAVAWFSLPRGRQAFAILPRAEVEARIAQRGCERGFQYAPVPCEDGRKTTSSRVCSEHAMMMIPVRAPRFEKTRSVKIPRLSNADTSERRPTDFVSLLDADSHRIRVSPARLCPRLAEMVPQFRTRAVRPVFVTQVMACAAALSGQFSNYRIGVTARTDDKGEIVGSTIWYLMCTPGPVVLVSEGASRECTYKHVISTCKSVAGLVTGLHFDSVSYESFTDPTSGFGADGERLMRKFGTDGETRYYTAVCERDFEDLAAQATLYDGPSFLASWMLIAADLLTMPGEVATGSPYAPPGRVEFTLGGKAKFQALLDMRKRLLASPDHVIASYALRFVPRLYIYAGSVSDVPNTSDPMDVLTFFCNYFPATLVTSEDY